MTEDPNDYRAQPVNVKSWSEAEIIDRVMDIGAGLTRSDVASVVEALKQVLPRIVREGGAFNTELFSASFSIQGVFTAGKDIDPHSVRLNVHAGSLLRDAVKGMATRRVDNVQSGGLITSVQDVKSGSVNGTLTPDRDLRINGSKLKVMGEDAAVGVYFVNLADASRTKVDPTDVVTNNPSELMVVIPALAAGTYNVQVVTQYSGAGRLLANSRTISSDKPLTVAQGV
ncbi:MAG: DUF4469 domain-containing protein [Spirochaetaceae bacterium]|nr:DUF4469 domain-containing protein [Spirochaetaceae bacterium]